MVSLTNSLKLLLIESGMSLMYMRNMQDPCGTSDNTVQRASTSFMVPTSVGSESPCPAKLPTYIVYFLNIILCGDFSKIISSKIITSTKCNKWNINNNNYS